MLGVMISILVCVGMLITWGIVFAITSKTINYIDKTIITALIEFIKELFTGRNMFGIVLSLLTLIIAIPAMLVVLAGELVIYIRMGITHIWQLGNKK